MKVSDLNKLSKEEIVQQTCRDIFGGKSKITKTILNKFAQFFFEAHKDIFEAEIVTSIRDAKKIDDIAIRLRELTSIAPLDANFIIDELMKRPDSLKITGFALRYWLDKADDDRFIALMTRGVREVSSSKFMTDANEDDIKRIVGLKDIKNHPELILLAEKLLMSFVARNKGNVTFYGIDRMLPSMGVMANHSLKIKAAFEAMYIDYLEKRPSERPWEQKTYVSVLCRALRNYKDKEFRNVLIKKLVLIRIPTLQKRMAREFSKSRRYLAMS